MNSNNASLRQMRTAARICIQICCVTALAFSALSLSDIIVSASETDSYSRKIAELAVKQPVEAKNFVGQYPDGQLLEGMHAAWYNSADGDYFRYERKVLDAYLQSAKDAGPVSGQDSWAAGLLGSELLLMYEVTRDPGYYAAATSLNSRLASVCNVPSGSAPCEAESFLAAYASAFQHETDLPTIADEFERWNAWLHANRRQNASDAQEVSTSRARILVALVDALANFKQDSQSEQRLLSLFKAEFQAVAFPPAPSVLNQTRANTQIQEATDSRFLIIYALLKGVRLGYLPSSTARTAESEWRRLTSSRAFTGVANGALLLASTEMDLIGTASLGRDQTVLLDGWFNSQQRRNAADQTEYFHYKWQDYSDSGYSLFGHIFRGYGVSTDALYSAPTRAALAEAQYYVIVSPDIPVKNPNPHYMTEHDAEEIEAWVSNGGVLVMLENDPPNADIEHLDLLADKFGIHFENVLHHHVVNDKTRGDHIEDGTIPVASGSPLFHNAHTLYMKDTCAITLTGPTQALLQDRGDVVMAMAKHGKGMVFAAVDPWAYNEYTDGRKDQNVYRQFDNFSGAQELVRWLVEQRNMLPQKGN